MKQMSLDEKESKILEIRKSIQELQSKLNPLTNKLIKLQKEVNDEKMNSLLPLTLEKLFSTPASIIETDLGFKEINNLMKNYPYVYISGHNSETKTKWPEVMFKQTQDFDVQKDCVLEVIKYLPYQTNQAFKNVKGIEKHPSKFKLFGVFHQETEHDGVYYIMVDDKDNSFLINTRYSRVSCVKQCKLNEMLKYVYDNHPYESIDNEDDCDNEDDN